MMYVISALKPVYLEISDEETLQTKKQKKAASGFFWVYVADIN